MSSRTSPTPSDANHLRAINPPRDSSSQVGRSLRIVAPMLVWACFATICLPIGLARQSDADSASASGASAPVMRRVTFEEAGQLRVVVGEVVAENDRLGQLILDADGALTSVSQDELKRVEELSEPLVITPAKELAKKTLKLMPAGSKSIITDHFVVCYNTSDVYARWNANLYERLYKGFYRFWKDKGVELTDPRFPLVALVFETKDDYINYASREFQGAENTLGYYHQATNRLASFDLTGVEGMIPDGVQVNREDLITQILSRPQAERTVATIVHEACHLLAYNSGLQTRLGDSPLWLSEGIAMFFETPDFTKSTGWGGIGQVNWHNHRNLIQYSATRDANSLEKLIVEDDRLRQAETMASSYAEAWGLTYYLLKRKPKQFVEYLAILRERAPGKRADAKRRLEEFKACFGNDLSKVDKEFIRTMSTIR